MEFIRKIAIVGEGGVGKTTMVNAYISGQFNSKTEMTIGAEFFTKEIVQGIIHGKLLLWDLGGQEQFGPMMRGYLQGTEGVLLVYDLSRLISLIKLSNWIAILKKANVRIDGEVPIVLVGCKKDLCDPNPEDEDTRKEYTESIKESCVVLGDFQTSSLTRENIKEAFDCLIDYFLKKAETNILSDHY